MSHGIYFAFGKESRQFIVCILLISGLMSACHSGSLSIPVYSVGEKTSTKSQIHVVRKGDTLYSIAFKHGLDYRKLAQSNGISKPYTIFLGQNLRLSNQKSRVKTPISKSQKTVVKAKGKKIKKPITIAPSKSQDSKINWRWPIPGKVVNSFSLKGHVNKGVDIRGKLGESVHNAAAGVVVYAGGGIRGYGKLIIVKHDDHFLSAYGNNRAILVKEGDKVKGGQVVAEIGSSDSDQQILHFEIRKNGKPEDPLIYLPDRHGKL